LALQMTQTPCFLKSKVEIILDVSHLNLTPCMVIMLLIHSLHLVRLIVEILTTNGSSNKTSPLDEVLMQRHFQCKIYHSSILSI
jgi:hypothetical protein